MNNEPALVVWFCGLPGSGKTSIATRVLQLSKLTSRKPLALVSMDEIRGRIFPNPVYSDEERDTAYRAFVVIASLLSKSGVTTILDGSGHKRLWRELARKECPKFVEVYVRCPIEICIERENNRKNQTNVRKKLYSDALERLRTGERIKGLGKVPGVDEPFEESSAPEILIDSSQESLDSQVKKVIQRLKEFEPSVF